VSLQVHRRGAGECVSVTAGHGVACGSRTILREVSEDTLPCRWRENVCNEFFFSQVALSFIEEKEKSLVLFNRSTNASAELIAIGIGLTGASKVVEKVH